MKKSFHKLFQLSQLKKLLCISYERYTGTSIELHSTRFKEDLLQYFPGLKAYKNGKQMILTPDSVIDAITRSGEDDGMCLVQAAKVIRQDMFDKAKTFHGNFDKNSQEDSVPTSWMMLIRTRMN